MLITDIIISGGLVSLIGLVWKAGNDNTAMVTKASKENDEKISRVYTRLDDVKKTNDNTFTRKDVCQILHSQINEKLDNHSLDLKEIKSLVQEIKNNGKK
jgi:hypothetical protein